MCRRFGNLGKAYAGLLALAALGAFPAAAAADGLGFRNDLNIPIIVQGESVMNNVLQRGQPLLIAPGKSAWDINLKPGVRLITIFDARPPNRVLLQRWPVPFQGGNVPFAVQPLPVPPNPLTRVRLVPLQFP